MKLIAVKANSSALNATNGVTIDVYTEHGTPATVLNSAITMNTALTDEDGTLASNPTSLSEGDVLGLRVTTGASPDDITNAQVTLTLIDA
jgi:hypothetical protein